MTQPTTQESSASSTEEALANEESELAPVDAESADSLAGVDEEQSRAEASAPSLAEEAEPEPSEGVEPEPGASEFSAPEPENDSSDVGWFGAGQLMDADQGDVAPSRGALDHPAAQFLGREFLLWLWWRSEEDFATANLPHYGTVDFWIDDHLQFRTPGDDPQINDIRGGAPATTIEARTALANGKTVESARLGIRIKEREYSFSLKGEGLELTGVKVPADAQDGIDDRVFERMLLLEELEGIIDTFFFQFLEQRLADNWRSERVPAIRSWIAGQGRSPAEA